MTAPPHMQARTSAYKRIACLLVRPVSLHALPPQPVHIQRFRLRITYQEVPIHLPRLERYFDTKYLIARVAMHENNPILPSFTCQRSRRRSPWGVWDFYPSSHCPVCRNPRAGRGQVQVIRAANKQLSSKGGGGQKMVCSFTQDPRQTAGCRRSSTTTVYHIYMLCIYIHTICVTRPPLSPPHGLLFPSMFSSHAMLGFFAPPPACINLLFSDLVGEMKKCLIS